uniref:Uncharacterized protein n=1 Tax=Arundo donax TaxID=35708 RepID=A0A0A9H2Y7_ARUDO
MLQGIREGLEAIRDLFLNRNEQLRAGLEERITTLEEYIATVQNNLNQRFNNHENAMTIQLNALVHEVRRLAHNFAQGGGAWVQSQPLPVQ